MEVDVIKKSAVARKLRGDFDRFWDLAIERGDADFLRYVYSLIFRVYEMHLQGKYMSKMQACRYIPLHHASTCKKYLELARERNYFLEVPSEFDKRKKIIKPGPALIDFVETSISESIDEMEEIIGKSK